MFLNKKSTLKFYIINVTIILLASLLVIYSIRASIQEKLNIYKSFSFQTIKFTIKNILFLICGYIFVFFNVKIFSVKPFISDFSKKQKALLFSSFFIYFLSMVMLILKNWAINRFPMDQIEIVIYTLKNLQTNQIDKSIFLEGYLKIFYALIISILIFCPLFIYQVIHKYCFIIIRTTKKISINLLFFIFSISIFFIAIFTTSKDLKIKEYPKEIRKLNIPPIDSDFYKNEYKIPKYENITFPSSKKNIIIILLESIESSFTDKENGGLMDKNLIPNLTTIANNNINFSFTDKTGGGIDLSGTGWTIAAMTAKFSGLPFNLMGLENGNRVKFLPNAITLTDILHENGYNQLFLFGSDKTFAGRDALLENHGNVEIHDTVWYKKAGLLPENYFVFWGFEDLRIYEFAKMELNKLSAATEPFMLGLLTVDTHMPDGYKCSNCPDTEDMPLKNAILCADSQISDFLKWCKEQIWYEDTVIAIMGDHIFMATKDTNPFPNNKYLVNNRTKSDSNYMMDNPRKWIDIFINVDPQIYEKSNIKNRKFSSYDMFPTILAAMNCEINDNRLGFGVNLFSDEKTLCERYSEEYINEKTMERNIQYLSLEVDKD